MAAVARRSFLRLLAAAPVALPVAAREAASKAGLTALGYGMPIAPSGASAGHSVRSGNDWIKDWAATAFSSAWKADRWEDFRNGPVGALDTDLACSRSFSMATAIRIQRQRNFERSVTAEQRSVLKRFKESFGFDFIPTTKET